MSKSGRVTAHAQCSRTLEETGCDRATHCTERHYWWMPKQLIAKFNLLAALPSIRLLGLFVQRLLGS